MYHTGSVGDCLLLLFQKDGATTFSMLIDCGGWLTSPQAIAACVKDIGDTCGGTLDLLVVTHQHMDHISGFNQARAEFDAIKVKEVWLSWIEDEGDPIAKVLKEQFGKKLKELKRFAGRALAKVSAGAGEGGARGSSKRAQQKVSALQDTLALIEFEEGIMRVDGKAARPTNDVAMKYVKGKGEKLEYLRPGRVVQGMPGAEGMKFFILGPPRDRDMRYFKIAENREEMYHLKARMAAAEEGEEEPTIENIVSTGIVLQDGVSPFEQQYVTRKAPKFSDETEEEDYAWRGIETDWLESAASIALRATRLTNNTSLAMAIQFEESGRVILLPGDAQSGNWMGWHKPEVVSALINGGGRGTEELLRDTVFYKVGHHGSHNGTASLSGLDLIGHKDLVAFMPLVQAKVPKEWGGAANFPAKKLYAVLLEKTRGRLVRTDVGLAAEAPALLERKKLNPREKSKLSKALKEGDNYFEFTIEG